MRIYSTVRDNVAIIGARAADKEGLNMAYEFC